ncbi:MAG: AAA family ATPase [Bacteroidaceae bacterium]|nr:AAA family ATPase [Bacteroidaceae bacterium]
MDANEIRPLVTVYHRKLAETTLEFKRSLYSRINWNVRMLGIKGEKGVGKTTLVLQHIKETFENPDDALYVSMDNLWFKTHSVMDLADYLYSIGVNYLYLDEIHKCKDWTAVLKNLYDNYPKLNVVYTGSSMLQIDNSKVDLSRRQTLYRLHNLSFREYLEYEGIASFEAYTLENVLQNHVKYAMDITSKVKVLRYFPQYLSHGMYPFYKESHTDFHIRLAEAVTQTLESDLPAIEDVTFETIQKALRLLMITAESLPFVPNVSRLCESLGTTRDSCLKILYALDRAGILNLLTSELKNYRKLVNPDKIFLGNPNIMYALGGKTETGTIRETFFANQVGAYNTLQYPKKGDFFASGMYLFEVGGPGKSFEQIKDEPDSFLAVDGTETGHGNRIPLWLFGFLY